ncbi:hypothetical protein [Paraliobacillus ryukyuensis]|uniref:hypothetical protein n=1 Tax=Paraliobacillus ryukyuensis TaxID=200904 RepID=UPI0009A8A096|nr:hypothetical protein [Paraliobacillus ryukyuensis]
MGYVLPVDNYQYQQYQNRVTQPERDPYPIEQLYPIQLDMSYQEELEKQQMEHTELSKQAQQNTAPTLSPPRMSVEANMIYANLTGVGQYINELI